MRSSRLSGVSLAASDASVAVAGPARRRRNPWRRVFVAALAVAILAVVAWALVGSSLLVVRHVRVTGAGGLVPAAAVISAAGVPLGTPLGRVDPATVVRRVEGLAPVLSARVTRSFPDTVVIAVRQRTPELAVAKAAGFALVDAYGVAVTSAAFRPAGLPLLSPAPPVLRGNPAVRAAADVVRELPAALRDRVSSVSASASSVTLTLSGRVTVVWGGPGQAVEKAAELSELLPTGARYYDVSDPATVVTQR